MSKNKAPEKGAIPELLSKEEFSDMNYWNRFVDSHPNSGLKLTYKDDRYWSRILKGAETDEEKYKEYQDWYFSVYSKLGQILE